MPRGDLFYILDHDHLPVPATFEEWTHWREPEGNCRVGLTEIGSDLVSTVFLGLNFGDGVPVLFETIVFRGAKASEIVRSHTWDEAIAIHRAKVAELQTYMEGTHKE